MSANPDRPLSGVAETLFFTLLIRAEETLRPDALIKDPFALSLVKSGAYDFSRLEGMKIDESDKTGIILRNREFDRAAREFVARRPDAVVIHIGCGLDSRFERIDDGRLEWYDLDLPDVIEARRRLIGGESGRYHHLASSALESAWMDVPARLGRRPFLFLAEGVLMYFEEAQVKSLVLSLRDHFPGSEFVFDAFSPLVVRTNNLRIARTKIGARYHWGLKKGSALEAWGQDIRLLEEWHIFDHPEPRLKKIRWMRFIPMFANAIGIYRFGLGKTGD
jgi:methyltransferase (TIGR00027 family)